MDTRAAELPDGSASDENGSTTEGITLCRSSLRVGGHMSYNSPASGWHFVLVALTCLGGCQPGSPSARAAEEVVRSSIDEGEETRLRLVSFEKTDGRSAEFQGVRMYALMFKANGEFVSDASYSVGLPLVREGGRIVTREYVAPGGGWDGFLLSSQGFRPARKGDRLLLTGEVAFEKRESGWVAVDVRFAFTHDSTARSGAAVVAPGSTDPRQSSSGDVMMEAQAAFRSVDTGHGEPSADYPDSKPAGRSVASTQAATTSRSADAGDEGPPMDRTTALGNAATAGNAELVRRLLADGVRVNEGYGYKGSWTPLMSAAVGGHTEVVQILIAARADLERSDDASGYTALGHAASMGHREVVRLLIGAGAKLAGGGDYDPVPPLLGAGLGGHADVLRELLGAGADRCERFRGEVVLDRLRRAAAGMPGNTVINAQLAVLRDC
jgi:hypothetical protein